MNKKRKLKKQFMKYKLLAQRKHQLKLNEKFQIQMDLLQKIQIFKVQRKDIQSLIHNLNLKVFSNKLNLLLIILILILICIGILMIIQFQKGGQQEILLNILCQKDGKDTLQKYQESMKMMIGQDIIITLMSDGYYFKEQNKRILKKQQIMDLKLDKINITKQANVNQLENKLDLEFILVITLKVNPEAVRQVSKLSDIYGKQGDNDWDNDFFVVNESKDIRPYRILLKEC